MEDFVNVDEIQISTDSSRTDNGDYNITATTKIFIHLTINHHAVIRSSRKMIEKLSKMASTTTMMMIMMMTMMKFLCVSDDHQILNQGRSSSSRRSSRTSRTPQNVVVGGVVVSTLSMMTMVMVKNFRNHTKRRSSRGGSVDGPGLVDYVMI